MIGRRRFLGAALVTALCGSATLTFADGSVPPRELTRIERLIAFVEAQRDLTFIRNGTAYTAGQAGQFLRGKLDSMGAGVTTARDFITRIASRSSMSGKAYEVRFADGRVMLAEQFLAEELQRIERQPA